MREVLADQPDNLRIRNVIFGGEALSPLYAEGLEDEVPGYTADQYVRDYRNDGSRDV